MSEELSRMRRLFALFSGTIERLVRERNQAREDAETYKINWEIAEGLRTEAEARGYERGVKEAAKLLQEGPRKSGLSWPNPDKAILALLEKPTS
jgi:hypothetical protein